MKLYQLADEYKEIQDLLESQEGALTEEIEAALNSIEGSLESKLESCGSILRNMEVDAYFLEAKIKVVADELALLKEKLSVSQNKIKSFKEYILSCLKLAGIDKIKTKTFSFWKQPTDSVSDVKDLSSVPKKFIRFPDPVPSLDKKAVLEYWKTLKNPDKQRKIGIIEIFHKVSLRVK
jgi:hypothetical protein